MASRILIVGCVREGAELERRGHCLVQVPDARGRMVNLTLLSAKSNTTSAVAAKVSTGKVLDTDSFSLMFKAARTLPPFTSIYTVSHPALGKFDLFLTPRTQDGVFYYEAVFNHI